MKKILQTLLGLAMIATQLAAHAADWPEREINLTVMYGAGGNTDIIARALAKQIEEQVGKPVVVANRPGALGTLGPEYVTRQKPDGYNLAIVTASALALAPHLVPVKFGLDDFSYVAAFAMPRFGIAVRADSSYRTLADLVQAAKGGKGVFFGSGAALNSLIMFDLNRLTGSKFEAVNYKSGAEVTTALLGGQVEATVQNPSDILPHIQSGKLRMLASASPLRWPDQPQVPTLKELGYESSGGETWIGLAAPKGTPKEIVQKLENIVLSLPKKPEFQSVLAANGTDSKPATGAELDAYLKKRYVEWGDFVKKANLAPPK